MASSLELTYDVIGKLSRAATAQDICDGLTSFTGRYGLTSMMAASLPATTERKSLVRRRHLLLVHFRPLMDHYFKQGMRISTPLSAHKHDLRPSCGPDACLRAPGAHAVVGRVFREACGSISRRGSWCR